MKPVRRQAGFTLIELMIVVVIIGILAAIAIPRFTSVSRGAKQAEAAPILKQLCSLAEAEHLRDSAWPDGVDGIAGWTDPGAEYFTFSFADAVATASLTAAGTEAGLVEQTMDCATGDLGE